MAWAIITMYTSKCAQMDPQQLPKTSKFYSRCKKCDIEKTLGGGYPPPLVDRRLTYQLMNFSRLDDLDLKPVCFTMYRVFLKLPGEKLNDRLLVGMCNISRAVQ